MKIVKESSTNVLLSIKELIVIYKILGKSSFNERDHELGFNGEEEKIFNEVYEVFDKYLNWVNK